MPSAVIKSSSYDPAQQTLEIIYHLGKVYCYIEVPEKIFQEMRSTMVKGICISKVNTPLKMLHQV